MSDKHLAAVAAEYEKQAHEADLLAVLRAIEAGEVTITCEIDPVYCVHVEYRTSNGWRLVVFNDCGEWDYLDSAEAPDGRTWAFLEMSEAMQDYRPPDEVVRAAYKMEL